MSITLTSHDFFTKALDRRVKGLMGIDRVYLEKGQAAAEKQFADYVRASLNPKAFLDTLKAPEITDDIIAAGERILKGELTACGVSTVFPTRKNIDWGSNPTYNGYKEWTWGLSRHAEWITLARLYRHTHDERYTEAFSDYFMSWSSQTTAPPHGTRSGATLCWRTLECGIRLRGSWTEAIMSFISSPRLSDRVITLFFRSVWDNVDRILDSPSSGYNWFLAEMCGVNTVALCFPFFADSAFWYEHTMKNLENELDLEIYPEGFQFELTTGYHSMVINIYTEMILRNESMGKKIGKELKDKVRNLLTIYYKLMMPDRHTPDINDGKRINVPEFFRQMAENAPSLYADFANIITESGADLDLGSMLLEYCGYAMMRSGWGREDFCAMLESAPFGFSHQHEDKLEVLLHAYGKRMLDDVGNFRYDTSEMRAYVRSSYSHNVAIVDGFGQNRRSAYKWQKADIRKKADIRAVFADDIELAEGFYDEGFGEPHIPVRHERTLIWLKNGIGEIKLPFYVVYDKFIPADENSHKYTLLWHLNVEDLDVNGNKATADFGDGVRLDIVGMSAPTVIKGQDEPLYMGWRPNHTPGDHPHFPIPTVNYSREGKTVAVATVLFPTKNASCPVTAVNCDPDGKIEIHTRDGFYTVDKNFAFKSVTRAPYDNY